MKTTASLVHEQVRVLIKKMGRNIHLKKPYKKLVQASENPKKHAAVPVPKGHLALYVGKEEKRYQVPLKCLSCPTFQELIIESQPDVFDAKIEGPIVLACSTEFFDRLLMKVELSAIECN